MARNKARFNSASFKAQHSVTLRDLRQRNAVALATEHAPRNVRISQAQARGCTVLGSSMSNAELRDAMAAPSHVGAKRMAKNGCTTQNVMNQAKWRDDPHHSYGGVKK